MENKFFTTRRPVALKRSYPFVEENRNDEKTTALSVVRRENRNEAITAATGITARERHFEPKVQVIRRQPLVATIELVPKVLPIGPIVPISDDALLHVLNVISLQEKIRLRLVCPKWKTLITEHCLLARKSLKLFTCQTDLNWYSRGLIRLNSESDEHFRLSMDYLVIEGNKWGRQLFVRLQQILPNITSLVVYIRSHKEAAFQLHHLLEQYPALESLSLCGKLDIIPDAKRRPLFQCLNNRLPSLRRLDLQSYEVTLFESRYTYEPGSYTGFYIEPRLMRQLEHFSIGAAFRYYLPDILAALSPRSITTLRIDQLPLTEITLSHLYMVFMHLNPRLATCLTKLTVTALDIEEADYAATILGFICDRIPNLTEFHYDLPRESPAPLSLDLLNPLARLTQLKKLHLGFISIGPFSTLTTFEAEEEANNSRLSLPALGTVEHLSIVLVSRGRTKFFRLNQLVRDKFVETLSTVFSSLKVLILKPHGMLTVDGNLKRQLLSEEQEKQFPNLVRYEAYAARSAPGQYLGRNALT